MSQETYTEKYIFPNGAKAYINSIINNIGDCSGTEFFITLQRKGGEFIRIRNGEKNVGHARSFLEGFLQSELVPNFLNKVVVSEAGWSETFCIKPYPRPTSQSISALS